MHQQERLVENKEMSLREEMCRIGKLLFDRMFVAGTEGNVSVRLSNDEILVTPTQVSKGMMRPEMMVKVDLSGNVLSGELKPSSELPMHLKIYNDRPDVKAVVHAHPPYATAHAVSGVPFDRAFLPEAVVYLGDIPIAPYGLPSSQEIPEAIQPYLADHTALLLENHGALTWGEDLLTAYFHMENLEQLAKIHLYSRMLGGVRYLSQKRVDELIRLKDGLGSTNKPPKGVHCPDGKDLC
ncbi:MAG: class II aldolase/adducin family protein [Candidatus Carbobacillus altaicus]|nr:class II aldolase/adducin family protein [Candidatus Carbobacillus altaicus]